MPTPLRRTIPKSHFPVTTRDLTDADLEQLEQHTVKVAADLPAADESFFVTFPPVNNDLYNVEQEPDPKVETEFAVPLSYQPAVSTNESSSNVNPYFRFFLLVFQIAAAILLAVATGNFVQSLQFNNIARNGVRTNATVTNLEPTHFSTSSTNENASSSSDTVYTVSWLFVAPDGRTYSGTEEIRPLVWQFIRMGSPISIFYLPSDPTQMVLADSGTKSKDYGVAGSVNLLLLSIGGSVVIFMIRRKTRPGQ